MDLKLANFIRVNTTLNLFNNCKYFKANLTVIADTVNNAIYQTFKGSQ